jgi:hypothetical protein
LAHLREERLDGGLVAFEEMPLADLLAADQAGALQGRQVGGDGRLRQAAALIDLPGTDAVRCCGSGQETGRPGLSAR